MTNWLEYMQNPRSHILKKTMFEVLKERFSQNEQIIERMSATLVTEGDLNLFMKMVSDVYEIAYMKAVADHREQLQKVGLVAKIVSPS